MHNAQKPRSDQGNKYRKVRLNLSRSVHESKIAWIRVANNLRAKVLILGSSQRGQ